MTPMQCGVFFNRHSLTWCFRANYSDAGHAKLSQQDISNINKGIHEMNITLTPHPPRRSRVLRLPQVIDAVGLSKATIYRLAQMGKFPKPFKIGITAVGWDEAEIEFWIFERKMEATLH